jgi:hypothetical protein
MRSFARALVVLLLCLGVFAQAKKPDPEWKIGKILDESRARYYAGTLNNSSGTATENGSWNGSATSTSIGDSTTTQASGGYSGTRNTSVYGSSTPIYRVFDNLVIEGTDSVYITSERLRWRWSKSAHVAVNEPVRYYQDGRKLHVLDEDGKEHVIEVVKEIRKLPALIAQAEAPAQGASSPPTPSAGQTSVAIDSTPSGGDIEIDGAFVGNTPSTISLSSGSHMVAVKKTGYNPWSRTLNITSGAVHLIANLEQIPVSQ